MECVGQAFAKAMACKSNPTSPQNTKALLIYGKAFFVAGKIQSLYQIKYRVEGIR